MVESPLPGFGGCKSGLWAGITVTDRKHNRSVSVRQAPRSYGHSRCAGMACLNHWIPAFAGMTVGAVVRNSAEMAKGLSGWRRTHFDPVVIPAKAGIQERRPEGEGVAGYIGWRARLSLLWLSFPLCGNDLFQPLDSGLRRAATGLLPSRRIPDFLSINDGRG